ncbi:MAG: InlB B-repeat-containing protein [Treponema sp.]|nr:InlB B-repeat-containing protein [Treponema sp.]
MRKIKYIPILVPLVLIFAFTSCSLIVSSHESPSSSVTVNLPSRSRFMTYRAEEVIQTETSQGTSSSSSSSSSQTTETSGSENFTIKYNLILATDDGKTYDKITGHEEGPAVFKEVQEGTYKISVQALDPNDNIFATGQSELFQVTGDRESIVDILLYLLKFTVSFDANGGSGSLESTIITGTNQFMVPYIFGIEPPAEYVFTGWALSPSAQEPDYLPNQIITLTKDITLYALWSDINASVSSFAELKSAIESGKRNITLCNDINIDEDFTITASDSLPVKINGDSSYHITASGKNLSFTYVEFSNGYSNSDAGGMIEITGSSWLTLTECTFNNCSTSGGSYTCGGTIYVEDSSLYVNGCSFTYSSEELKAAENGGFIYIGSGAGTIIISASTFSGGYASKGGAIYTLSNADIGGSGEWEGCTFQNSIASSNGGAIYAGNASAIEINIRNTYFDSNSSTGDESHDIYSNKATITIDEYSLSYDMGIRRENIACKKIN